MNYYTLIIAGLFIFQLIKDFGKDKGQFRKAKTFHFICLLLICLAYSGSFKYFGWTIRHFDTIMENYSVDVGIVPGYLHLILYFLHLGFALTVLILAYQMLTRKEKARRLILYFLPFLAVTETFNFYRGWLSDGDDLEISHIVILLIGFLLVGGLTAGIMAVYNSNFMREFFKTHSIQQTETAGPEILDRDLVIDVDINPDTPDPEKENSE